MFNVKHTELQVCRIIITWTSEHTAKALLKHASEDWTKLTLHVKQTNAPDASVCGCGAFFCGTPGCQKLRVIDMLIKAEQKNNFSGSSLWSLRQVKKTKPLRDKWEEDEWNYWPSDAVQHTLLPSDTHEWTSQRNTRLYEKVMSEIQSERVTETALIWSNIQ